MLTRKDYIGFCHALAAGVATGKVNDSLVQWLALDNPAFDAAKFHAYLAKLIDQYEATRVTFATIEEK